MANFVQQYWDFMNRETSHNVKNVAEASPNLIRDSIIFSVYFGFIALIIPYVFKFIFPVIYKTMPDNKREDLSSFGMCFFHHVVVSALGFYYIYQDWNRTAAESFNFDYVSQGAKFVPFCFGYMFVDTLIVIATEVVRGKYDHLFHHLFSYGLFYFLIQAPGHITRYIPHVLICEFSQVIFNLASFLRMAKVSNDYIKFVEYAFVIAFILLRAINLPVAFYVVYWLVRDAVPVAGYVFAPLIGIQYFWVYKIFAALARRSGGKADAEDKMPEKSE